VGLLILRSSVVEQVLTGLDWDGNAASRRMLYLDPAPSMYPLTFLWKLNPRTCPAADNRFHCTWFLGNNGEFDWPGGGGYGNAYYGAHLYPHPNRTSEGKMEVACGQAFGSPQDEVTRDDASEPFYPLGDWKALAFVADDSGANWEHKLYCDLPSVTTANTISVTRQSAPVASPDGLIIMMGQTTPDPIDSSKSWGGEPRWEEMTGTLRGLQMYTQVLTEAQIIARAALDHDGDVLALNTMDAITSLHFLNMNPTPDDVTDKSGNGNHLAWDGAGRPTLWTE
jgi:hypothetical protein